MSNSHFDALLVGNSLTTLIAASELSAAGKRVCIVNPVPSWGGHFTKMMVGGIAFDPGAVSHEFTAFNADGANSPLEYDSRKRNDVGRFIHLIEQFTRSKIALSRMPAPQTVYGGQLVPDIVMSNQLDILQHAVLQGRAKTELGDIATKPQHVLHAKLKKTSEEFINRSYQEVSIANHGPTLHSALFEPMFYKMSGLSSLRLLALYHRIAWLPLYYPETLAAQYSPSPQALQTTYFSYPKLGHIGALAETLLAQCVSAGVTIIKQAVAHLEAKPGAFTVTTATGERLTGKNCGWSLGHDGLITAATGQAPNVFERWSACMVFVTVQRTKLLKEFSVLYSPDDRVLFYRACNQTVNSGHDEDVCRIVIEVNPDFAASSGFVDEAQIIAKVKEDFCTLGLVNDPKDLNVVGSKTLKNVLLLPSKENWNLLAKERDVLLEHYPGVQFSRNVEAFFTDTLNDQIIKGLKLAEQIRLS
jgi:hypothetical protein